MLMLQVSAMLYSLVAIATGSISLGYSNTTSSETPSKLDTNYQWKSCKLINPDESLQLNFTSYQPTPITVEFKKFTSINCFAKNFCNITWLKDNSFELPSFTELRHDKQVLEIHKAYNDLQGNYTCKATDSIMSITRTVEVLVSSPPWEKLPLVVEDDACNSQTAHIGANAEFFCFFFAGEQFDEVNVTWFKKTNISTDTSDWVPVDRLQSIQTVYNETIDNTRLREYSGALVSTAGKHLYIKNIDREAFDDYKLVATSSFGQTNTSALTLSEATQPPKADFTAVVTIPTVSLACLFLVIVAAATTWHFKKLDIKILLKNRYGTLEGDDGKMYDAFICYADIDLQFILAVRENLKHAGYRVCVRDIDFLAATTLVEEIILALKDSRRCIFVISPDFLTAPHSALEVDVATEQVMSKQLKIVPIIYRDITAFDLEEIPLLKRILTNVKYITWDDNNKETSTKQLLLFMPPRRQLTMDRIEERNLLEELPEVHVPLDAEPDRVAPLDGDNRWEMDRFPNGVIDTEIICTGRGQRVNAVPC